MNENSKIKKTLSKIKIEYLLVVVFLAVAVLIFFGGGETKRVEGEEAIDCYVNGLEKKLEESFSKVAGAGDVDVIISVKSGMETIVATEKITEGNKVSEAPILVGGKTVTLREDYPEIVGVIIVTKGADNLSLRMSLINSASVFLNIDKNLIQILKGR